MPQRIPQGRLIPPRSVDPIYKQQSPASPVHLSGSLILRSGTNGAVSQAALKNPMNQDMELLEIKFEVSGGQIGAFANVFGGTIWCDLTLGSIKLTNGSIPVWCFGRGENLEGEVTTGRYRSMSRLSP